MNTPKRAFFRTENGSLMFSSKSKQRKYKECERKTPLTNLDARRLIKEEGKKGKLLYTYLCPHCNNWHLTHIPQS